MRKTVLCLFFCLACSSTVASQPLSLLDIYEQTMSNNATLKGREHSIDQMKAQKDQALSRLKPQISATGNLSYNHLSQDETNALTLQTHSIESNYRGLRGVIQARQALFDLPSYRRLQGAEQLVKQSEQELHVSRLSITADIVDAYLDALQTVDGLNYIRADLELTASEAKRIHTMFERQLVKITDVLDVNAYFQSLRTRELETDNAKAVALEKLRELTGVAVVDIVPLGGQTLPPVPGQSEQWVEEARKNHPLLAATQYAVDAAERLVESAQAERLPQLALHASATYADNGGFDNRQLDPYSIGVVGLQLNIPIYSGSSIDASIRDAQARHQIAKSRRLEKLREIERQTRTAYLNAANGRARIDSTAQEVKAREKAREGRQRGYELGISTIGDLLESKKNLLKAHSEHASARYSYVRQLVTLRLWAGVLSQQDIEEINSWLTGSNLSD